MGRRDSSQIFFLANLHLTIHFFECLLLLTQGKEVGGPGEGEGLGKEGDRAERQRSQRVCCMGRKSPSRKPQPSDPCNQKRAQIE